MDSACKTQENNIRQLYTWNLEHNPEPLIGSVTPSTKYFFSNPALLFGLLITEIPWHTHINMGKYLEIWLSVHGYNSSNNLIRSCHLSFGTSILFVVTVPLLSQIRSRCIHWLLQNRFLSFFHTQKHIVTLSYWRTNMC